MSPALEQLVRDAVAITGAEKPELLDDDSPALDESALSGGKEGDAYFVGLIGGKEVGKSALINALVGKPITAVTSHGVGTEIAIAYAHLSQRESLKNLLDVEIPGQFRIVTHELANLRRQVLLDLPDIDSRYASHLQVTRAMLRHMLYPVWVASVEKYADAQPQQMLARVAEGNTPDNFVFVINKADQLRAGPAATDAAAETSGASAQSPLEELRADCAARLQRALELEAPPKVYMISAEAPVQFDLPALRAFLMQQKTEEEIREARRQAAARQNAALAQWLAAQNLALRALRLVQITQDAEESVRQRIGSHVLEKLIPRLLDDPAGRAAMADEILQERIGDWPVLNVAHTVFQPLFALLRSAVSKTGASPQDADAAVESAMIESGESIKSLVQSTFGQLRHAQPAIAPHYETNKLWEEMPAEQSADQFRRILADGARAHRQTVLQKLRGDRYRPIRSMHWALTVGALLWFPFLQPVLARVLSPDGPMLRNLAGLIGVIIGVLGVDYLLKNAGFLAFYFALLWLTLRWITQRRVARQLRGLGETDDSSTTLADVAVRWLASLTNPLREARDQMQSLADRAAAIQIADEEATTVTVEQRESA